MIRRRLALHAQTEHHALLNDGVIEWTVGIVKPDRRMECRFGTADTRDVIQVRVRQQDVPDRQAGSLNRRDHLVDFIAGIDDDGVTSRFASEDVAVLVERRRSVSRQQHG